jgi:hypothetical protein
MKKYSIIFSTIVVGSLLVFSQALAVNFQTDFSYTSSGVAARQFIMKLTGYSGQFGASKIGRGHGGAGLTTIYLGWNCTSANTSGSADPISGNGCTETTLTNIGTDANGIDEWADPGVSVSGMVLIGWGIAGGGGDNFYGTLAGNTYPGLTFNQGSFNTYSANPMPYFTNSPSTAVQLSWPTNATSTQNFQSWSIHVNNLPTSTLEAGDGEYHAGVFYSKTLGVLPTITNGVPTNGVIDTGNAFSGLNVDVGPSIWGMYDQDGYNSSVTQCTNGGTGNFPCYVHDVGDSFYLSIPKFTRLGEGTWYAYPYIAFEGETHVNSTTVRFSQPVLVAQESPTTFVVSATSTLPANSTSTNLAAALPADSTQSLLNGFGKTVVTPSFTPATTTTSFVQCLFSGASSTFNLWNGSDWQCLLLNTTDKVKDAATSLATDAFDAGVAGLSNVFPLSLAADFNNDIAIAKNAVASTTPAAVTLGNGNSKIFAGHTFTLFNASTTNWIQNNTGFDYRGFASKLIYFVLGLSMLSVVIELIRKMHNTGQGQ